MTHYKRFMNKDFLGAYSIDGDDLILTIAKVAEEEFTGERGKDRGLVIRWKENEKPMICNATNAKRITALAGSPHIEKWIGLRIALYADNNVRGKGGEITEGIRVREYHPKTDEYICAECGLIIEDSDGLTARQIAEGARAKHGKYLCLKHAKEATAAKEAEAKKSDVLGGSEEAE